MDRPLRERADRAKNLVGFLVGDVHYAVDIFQVSEIIKPQPVIPLPHAPSAVVGVADHRGAVVPVMDLRRRFGVTGDAQEGGRKWIIVRSNDKWIGLICDRVTDVFGAEPAEQRDVPEFGIGAESRGIAAVYRYRGQLVFVVDVALVTAPAEDVDTSGARALTSGEEAT